MRWAWVILLIPSMGYCQESNSSPTVAPSAQVSNGNQPPAERAKTATDAHAATIPAGTKIPLLLKQAISTKNAREGDAVYAETAFPFVFDNRVLVPAATFSGEDLARGARRPPEGAGGGAHALSPPHLFKSANCGVSRVGGSNTP